MMGWAWYSMPTEEELRQQQIERALQDSLAAVTDPDSLLQSDSLSGQTGVDQIPQSPGITAPSGDLQTEMGIFSETGVTDTVMTVVRTPRYEAHFTNLGAGPAKYILRDNNTWDQRPIQMINDTTHSAYSLGFQSNQSYNIDTDRILFRLLTEDSVIDLEGEEEQQLQYALEIEGAGSIIYTYTFHAERYTIDLDIEFSGIEQMIIGNSVDFGWEPRLSFTEMDRTQDGMYASAYVYAGGVLEQLNVDGPDREEFRVNGNIDWVATKTKFFTQILKAETPTSSALLIGEVNGPEDEQSTAHHYQSFIQNPIPEDGVLSYHIYIGPQDYYEMRNFDDHAFDMVDISYGWMRWFADPLVKWVIIPFFTFFENYIPNYGILIILFGVAVKLLLAPLTRKSFESMAAMKDLQPEMKELQEKYKDNPKKQQEETIKLYKKAKVNPLGGCLPMLLQFPILITLWMYFQSSILIRQEPFLWANDLSAPDYILSLPFSIPFLGDQIAGFVLLMTLSMVAQTKVSGGMSAGAAPAGAPNMKAFTYMLPVMLLFIFNNFASGLSLYYLVYNVMSIGQQVLINRRKKDVDEDTSGSTDNNKPKKVRGKKKRK